ncbi:Uncharacterized protein PHSC3_000535 [Chlamydiales bacterium STE3]|nr:Uncharacterized protein PHSC3_000535 [Chlamydiales bacterium STE3]
MDEAVIGIVVNANLHLLITKRADTPIWVLPGGGIDKEETPEAAVIREVKEETGLDVMISYKCAEYTPINALSAKTHVFVCEWLCGTLKNSPETQKVQFSPLDHLPKPFFFLHQEWLTDWQNSKGKLVLKKIHQVTPFAILKFFFRHPIILIKYLLSKKIPFFLSNKN